MTISTAMVVGKVTFRAVMVCVIQVVCSQNRIRSKVGRYVLRFHNHQALGPPGPDSSECRPEQPVRGVQFRTRSFASEDRDLLSQGEDFESGISSTMEEDTNCSKESKDEFEHELTPVTWRNVAGATQRLRTVSC